VSQPITAELRRRFEAWDSLVSMSIDEPWSRGMLPVAVQCRLGSLPRERWALWDTGAAWSVIGPDVARFVHDDLGPEGARVRMSTRFGLKSGFLRSLRITFPAKHGPDVGLDATFLVVEEAWEGPIVLGVHGLMERLRFGFDPGGAATAGPLLAIASLVV